MMNKPSDYLLRVQYPELRPFFEWSGWPSGMSFLNRWRIGEIVWTLREGGPVEHKGNATKVLREKVEARDDIGGLVGATSQQWSNLLGEMAGAPPTPGRKYQWRPPLIMRKVDGTRTKRLEANPAAEVPPNPLPLYRAHLERSREAAAKRDARQAAPVVEVEAPPVPKPVADPIPEPGLGKAKLDALLGKIAAPEPTPVVPVVPPVPVVAAPAPQLFVNDDHTVVVPPERAVLDVDDVVASGSGDGLDEMLSGDREPFLVSPPPLGLVDALVNTGNRTLVDNARLLLSLAGDMLTQAVVAEASAGVESAQVDGEVRDRLGAALEEAQRLRKKLQAAETVKQQSEALARRTEAALRAERERADILEGNVERLLKGEKAENTRALKGAQRFLSEKPRVPAGT